MYPGYTLLKMKTAEEILFRISGVKDIHKTIYNASEVVMAINEARNEAIEECAEKADELITALKGGAERKID